MKFTKAEIDALIAASPRATAPFNKLTLSPTCQARPRGATSTMSIAELAASIKVNGLLHNLIVVKGARGGHEVCAGGRRLEALTLLVKNGDLPENYPVPVMTVPAETALMASLIENIQRQALHPADELVGFTRLIDEGKSVEDVAAAFGVTPLVVKRRLKLAAVSPKLMTEFREGSIGMDCLMVLAAVDDHERQERTWAGMPSWNRTAEHLRQTLSHGEIESDIDPVARFVTLAAYEKAGGASRRDLFCDDDKKAYLLDAALLERLAVEKLQRKAKQVFAEGWKWVEVRARYKFDEFVSFGEIRKQRREPTDDEAGAIAKLEEQIAALHDQMEALSDQEGEEDECTKLGREEDKLQLRYEQLQEALSAWPEVLVGRAGCVVFVGRRGTAEVKCGLIRPEDRDAAADASAELGNVVSLPATKTRPLHSSKLIRRLTAHRVAAIQAELIDRPDVALAAITAHLAVRLMKDGFRCYVAGDHALTVNAADTHDGLRGAAEDMADSEAWLKLETERRAWVERLPRDGAAIFPWLMQQERDTVLGLLTLLVASSVTGVSDEESEKQTTDGLARALGLDMRKWWSATAASYFDHVSKGRCLEVVTEAAGANAASPLASLKKDATVAGAAQLVAGTGWLPTCLRTPASMVGAAGETATDEA